ncbi:hypothetical protein GCM10018777_00400 [Streptomyces albogriseolus]|nr:hypothetical protein GCM10018777_00400 [Streptomyces viridodiastaticus]
MNGTEGTGKGAGRPRPHTGTQAARDAGMPEGLGEREADDRSGAGDARGPGGRTVLRGRKARGLGEGRRIPAAAQPDGERRARPRERAARGTGRAGSGQRQRALQVRRRST